jgi:hypothetical protein
LDSEEVFLMIEETEVWTGKLLLSLKLEDVAGDGHLPMMKNHNLYSLTKDVEVIQIYFVFLGSSLSSASYAAMGNRSISSYGQSFDQMWYLMSVEDGLM